MKEVKEYYEQINADGEPTGKVIEILEGQHMFIRDNKKKKEPITNITLNLDDLDIKNTDIKDFLWNYLKKTGEVNEYNRYRYNGGFISKDLLRMGINENITEYITMLMLNTSYNNKVKLNKTTVAKNWTDFYTALGIKSRSTGSRIKKILVKHDVIRLEKKINSRLGEDSCIFVNPNFIRNSTHISKECIVAYRDITLKKLSKYVNFHLIMDEVISKDEYIEYTKQEMEVVGE